MPNSEDCETEEESSPFIDPFQLMLFSSEFICTTLLICIGCMGSAEDDPLKSALRFGFTTLGILNSFGFISGAHANPAVTVACWMYSYISTSMAVTYMVAQFLGATFGYFLLTLLLSDSNGLCVVEPKGSEAQAFGVEFALTSALLLSWSALWDCRNKYQLETISIRIGLSLAACIFMGMKVTGAGMNPARTLAPAVFQGDLSHIWICFGGQFSAGLVVPMFWKLIFMPHIKVMLVDVRCTSEAGNH